MAVNKARQGRLHNLNCKYMPKKGTRGWWGVGQRETAIERASEKAKGDQMRNACICVCYCERAAYLHLHHHHLIWRSLPALLHNILELELSLPEFPF